MGKKVVIVLGMHRSGTSAMTGALSLLGIDLGKNLMPAAPENEKGFFENVDFCSVHEAILSFLGASWDSIYQLPSDWWRIDELQPYKRQIRDIIERDFGNKDIFAVKDPRLCRLLPLWQEILDDLHIEPLYIMPVRNPQEVAQSLMKRNHFSLEKGVLLWTLHNLDAERYTRSSRRIVISYDELLKHPDHLISVVAEQFNIIDSRGVHAALPAIQAFLEPSLRHHRDDQTDQYSRLPSHILKLYRLLRDLSERVDESKPVAGDIFATVDEVTRMFDFFYVPELQNELSTIPAVKRELEIAQQELSESLLRCERTEAQLRYMKQVLHLMEGSISWRYMAPLRFAKARLFGLFKKEG